VLLHILNLESDVCAPVQVKEVFCDSDCPDDPSSSGDELDLPPEDLRTHLRQWYRESGANLTQLTLLLEHLQVFHPDLPSDARTIVRTPRETQRVKHLHNGTYVHIGLKSGL